MSIKGFNVNGVVHKYDFNALENIPDNPGGGGVTQEIADALLACFQNVAWKGQDGQDYYDNLAEALNGAVGVMHSIAYSLSHVTLSNMATSIIDGGTYSATVTVAADYEVSSVTATMGGTPVQGAYSNGVITITNVTGDIVITATAVQRSATLTGISAIYSGGSIYTTTSLESLKSDLVVTASWSAGPDSTVSAADYSLAVSGGGDLVVGTNTIVVSYTAGQVTETDTFDVTATLNDNSLYNWDFTQSLTDSKAGVIATLGDGMAQDSTGVYATSNSNAYATLANMATYASSSFTVEFDLAAFVNHGGSYNAVLISLQKTSTTDEYYGLTVNSTASDNPGNIYCYLQGGGAAASGSVLNIDSCVGHTVKWQIDYSNKESKIFVDGTLYRTWTLNYASSNNRNVVQIGTTANYRYISAGTRITGLRIYAGLV